MPSWQLRNDRTATNRRLRCREKFVGIRQQTSASATNSTAVVNLTTSTPFGSFSRLKSTSQPPETIFLSFRPKAGSTSMQRLLGRFQRQLAPATRKRWPAAATLTGMARQGGEAVAMAWRRKKYANRGPQRVYLRAVVANS
jgi:hypothetical protein